MSLFQMLKLETFRSSSLYYPLHPKILTEIASHSAAAGVSSTSPMRAAMEDTGGRILSFFLAHDISAREACLSAKEVYKYVTVCYNDLQRVNVR